MPSVALTGSRQGIRLLPHTYLEENENNKLYNYQECVVPNPDVPPAADRLGKPTLSGQPKPWLEPQARQSGQL